MLVEGVCFKGIFVCNILLMFLWCLPCVCINISVCLFTYSIYVYAAGIARQSAASQWTGEGWTT